MLITRGRIDHQLGKIVALTPPDERRKAFRLLIAAPAVPDERHRERFCSTGARRPVVRDDCSPQWAQPRPESDTGRG